MREEKYTAILVVSFGTTHLDTLKQCIASTEQAIAEKYPGCPVYRAFLSGTVMRRLKAKYDMQVDNVSEALTKILHDGYRQVVVQPTLLLGGIEYDLLKRQLSMERNLKITVGRPLIENLSDCEDLASILIEENPLKEQEALVLMGHGTEHKANSVYDMLQEIFVKKEYPCFIGTVESTPSFTDAVEKLKQCGTVRAKLLPLMFVAGDHAKNDMAGEEDSLLCMVREAGIEAEPILRGLGESRKVQELYALHVEAAFTEAVL